jgi:hypothetical protein
LTEELCAPVSIYMYKVRKWWNRTDSRSML